MRATLIACACFAVVVTAHAQTPAPGEQNETDDQPTFRTGVNTVRVDVTVSGRDHQPVSDLTPQDFEVREDGVVQRVESLQFIRLTGQPPRDSDESLTIRSPEHAAQEAARDDVRLLVIFIDDYHLTHGVIADHRLRKTLRQFVLTQMRPLDLFAVMGPLTPMSHLRLTRDRHELLQAIDHVEGRLGGFVPPRSVLEENQSAVSNVQLVRAQVTLSALESLVVHLSGLREGRKSVLFVSQGPPLIADRLPMWDRLQDVITAANTGNVTIHTLDPRDLGMAPIVTGSNDALSAETGGRRLAQSNDYTRALRAVMADASAYYLLGYTPTRQAADGKFHKIDVRVRRKGVRVLARRGYWAPSEAELQPSRTTQAPPEITGVLTALKLSARAKVVSDWIGVGPLRNGRTNVTVVCAAAPPTQPASIGAIEVELVGGDDEVLGIQRAQPTPGGTWLARFDATPAAQRVRIAVQDPAGDTLDTWIRPIDVPLDGEPAAAIGTPVVFTPKTVAAWKALIAGEDMLPAVDRRFRRTDRVVVRLPLSPALTLSDVRAELVNRQGQTLLALPIERPSAAADAHIELPVASLAQSEYVLRLTAGANGATAAQLVPFAVIP